MLIESTFLSCDESLLVEDEDRRIKLEDTKVWPFCAHGRFTAEVQTSNGPKMSVGSGTMIGPNMVLTCAHNVYDRKVGIAFNQAYMRFYLGINGTKAIYGTAKIKSVYFPEEYKRDKNEDYALLILNQEKGNFSGYFEIYEGSKDNLVNVSASLYGYPAQMPGQSKYDHTLWGMEGPFEIDQYNDIIYHQIDTTHGQSESPLYIQGKGSCYSTA
jgi:glutamyl endopeptidase